MLEDYFEQDDGNLDMWLQAVPSLVFVKLILVTKNQLL